MVFANKCDVEDPAEIQVSDEDIQQFVASHPSVPVIKTSARTGQAVDESFLGMTKRLILRKN